MIGKKLSNIALFNMALFLVYLVITLPIYSSAVFAASINSVEVYADTAYFATTAGLLKFVFPQGEYILTADNQDSFTEYHFVDISMNTTADMMLFSRVFSTLHFNGESFYYDEQVSDVQSTWARGGMLKGNICAAVGYCCGGQYAYIARGYRIN